MFNYGTTLSQNILGPECDIKVTHPFTNLLLGSVRAIIDTGSDRTYVPIAITKHLKVKINEKVNVVGAVPNQERCLLDVKILCISVDGLEPVPNFPIACYDWFDYAILGRDFLNNYKIVLDAPDIIPQWRINCKGCHLL